MAAWQVSELRGRAHHALRERVGGLGQGDLEDPLLHFPQVNKAVPRETYVKCAEVGVRGRCVFWVFGVGLPTRFQAGLLPVVVGAHSGAFDLVPKEAPQDMVPRCDLRVHGSACEAARQCVSLQDLDYFHELIFVDELARPGGGTAAACSRKGGLREPLRLR